MSEASNLKALLAEKFYKARDVLGGISTSAPEYIETAGKYQGYFTGIMHATEALGASPADQETAGKVVDYFEGEIARAQDAADLVSRLGL